MNFTKLKRAYIIAEIGVNHEGKLSLAKKMIDLASKSGVDGVKFQTYKHSQYVSSSQPERLDRVKKFQLSHKDFLQIKKYTQQKKIDFFSTPLHCDDVDFLKKKVKLLKFHQVI